MRAKFSHWTRRLQAPIASVSTELRVYENEFHPLGGVTAEVFRLAVE
jgi:hypothetical protein